MIEKIKEQKDPVARAALIHLHWWNAATTVWERARSMRDALIDKYDPDWPHMAFWGAVDELSNDEK